MCRFFEDCGITLEGLPRLLVDLRARYRLTQREVGERLGVNPALVSLWERCERTPNRVHQVLLLKTFPELEVLNEAQS